MQCVFQFDLRPQAPADSALAKMAAKRKVYVVGVGMTKVRCGKTADLEQLRIRASCSTTGLY